MVFKQKHSNQGPTELELKSNSIYVMSKSSQSWFRHGIPPPNSDETVDERFSITFRSLSKKAKRGIILMGDSNSKEVSFGTGSGKVGESYPGKRVRAAKVSDINPHLCTGYSNIFLMCGTNDLRPENVRNESDIHHVVSQLKRKLYEMKKLCPTANIFVMPVLPTRLPHMNENIMLYNRLVNDMLLNCFPDVWFQGMYGFLDRQNLLSTKLTRANDKIHLGSRGIAKLVSLIKNCVFLKEKQTQAKPTSYSEVVQGSTQKVGSPEPT